MILSWDSAMKGNEVAASKQSGAVFGGAFSLPETRPKDDDAVVEQGDTVDIVLEATKDGEIYELLTAPSRLYDMGSMFLPQTFEDALLGMRRGETKEFVLELPHSDTPWDESDKTQSIELKVTVNCIMVPV